MSQRFGIVTTGYCGSWQVLEHVSKQGCEVSGFLRAAGIPTAGRDDRYEGGTELYSV